jgi:hypothetical protein
LEADKVFESSQVVSPITDVAAFLAGLRFEYRDQLAGLPLDLVKPDSESTAEKGCVSDCDPKRPFLFA